MIHLLKGFFYRIIYSPGKFSGRSENFEKLFRSKNDPWNFEKSAWERKRFSIISEFIAEVKPHKVLEVGCAEGACTEKIAEKCGELWAIDASKTALEKAQKRVPKARFLCGDFAKLFKELSGERFDMVVASEVLYYIKEEDIRDSLKTMNTRYLLTSNFGTFSTRLNNIVMECGFCEVKSRWLRGIDDLQLKSSKITLWER
ncbi:MAG: class I SAM-dependent methyltransferase [Candidatus Altiarchaeota archaeon]|nr:class I SAM-dependent methyltransferase [Candidatus Altiarchaeota archaeon]